MKITREQMDQWVSEIDDIISLAGRCKESNFPFVMKSFIKLRNDAMEARLDGKVERALRAEKDSEELLQRMYQICED